MYYDSSGSDPTGELPCTPTSVLLRLALNPLNRQSFISLQDGKFIYLLIYLPTLQFNSSLCLYLNTWLSWADDWCWLPWTLYTVRPSLSILGRCIQTRLYSIANFQIISQSFGYGKIEERRCSFLGRCACPAVSKYVYLV